MSSEKEKSTKEVLQEYASRDDFLKGLASVLPEGSIYMDIAVEPRDVANMMILLKVARNNHAHPDDPGHRDNWVDIAGYAACGAEVDA